MDKRLEEMTHADRIAYLEALRDRLAQKKRREKAYLEKRARDQRQGRGRRSITDDEYEDDQFLEQDLLEVLQQLIEIDRKREIGRD